MAHSKKIYICMIDVPEGEEKKSNCCRDNREFSKTDQRYPLANSRTGNTKKNKNHMKTTFTDIIFKVLRITDKEENLRRIKLKKKHIPFTVTRRLIADYSIETMEARR